MSYEIKFLCDNCDNEVKDIDVSLCPKCIIKKIPRNRKEQDKLYHERNKEYRNQQAREYYQRKREQIRAQRAKFHEENPNNRKEQQKKRRERPEVKLEMTLRRRARRCLVYGPRCMEYLGCSIHFLQLWFKFLFNIIDTNMTLENHGSYWEIDHVKPCSSFDLQNEEQVKECFHWTNVSPLEKSLNRQKSNNYTEEDLSIHKERVNKFLELCNRNDININLDETLDTADLS